MHRETDPDFTAGRYNGMVIIMSDRYYDRRMYIDFKFKYEYTSNKVIHYHIIACDFSRTSFKVIISIENAKTAHLKNGCQNVFFLFLEKSHGVQS